MPFIEPGAESTEKRSREPITDGPPWYQRSSVEGQLKGSSTLDDERGMDSPFTEAFGIDVLPPTTTTTTMNEPKEIPLDDELRPPTTTTTMNQPKEILSVDVQSNEYNLYPSPPYPSPPYC